MIIITSLKKKGKELNKKYKKKKQKKADNNQIMALKKL